MKKCLLCGRIMKTVVSLGFMMSFKPYRRSVICKRCRRRFKLISKDHRCRECSRPGDFPNKLCSDCRRWQKLTDHHFKNDSLYRYGPEMSEYMHRYKFQGDYRLRAVFQSQFSQFVNSHHRINVPIPVHLNTYRQRGFNQVKGLLKNVRTVSLLETKATQKRVPQSHKTRNDRLRLKQPFRVVSDQRNVIKNQDVAVVDDVYTTGTTIRHAAGLLTANGAKSVVGITLAR